MGTSKFSIRKRLKSFQYAFNGLRVLLLEEHNAWIHLFAVLLVIAAGVYFKVSVTEWCVISIAIGQVFAFEIINSAIENLADFVHEAQHIMIKKIKDLAAAAVLVSALAALICALFVFIPKMI